MKSVFLLLSLTATTAAGQQTPQPTVIIGGAEDRGAQLSSIARVTVLPQLLVVLEGAAPFVKVFDHHGVLRQTTGAKGGGPGEFQNPSAIVYDSIRHEVLIVDRSQSRVVRYAIGDTLRPAGSYGAIASINDLCVIGDRFYALASRAGTLVQELVIENERFVVKRSLGTLQSSHQYAAHPSIQSIVPQGRIACDGRRKLVHTASELLGDVQTIAIESGAQSHVAIRGFKGMVFTPGTEGGSLSMDTREDGIAETLADIRVNGAALAVTVVTTSEKKNTTMFSVATLASDGTQSRVPYRWQPIGRVGGMAICTTNDPAPTIAYFSAARCP